MIGRILLSGAAFILCVALFGQLIRNRRISSATWDELISRVEPSSMIGITLLAVEYDSPDFSDFRNLAGERWGMIGGWQGLKHIWTNSTVLIALAAHCEQWGTAETSAVAELMRRDGMALRRSVLRIILRAPFGRTNKMTGRHLQIAAACYHMMTIRLLKLYEASPSGHLELLSNTVWC